MFNNRFSAGNEAHILWGLGIRSPSEVTDLVERLNASSMPTIDISGIEAAQVRFMSFTNEIPSNLLDGSDHDHSLSTLPLRPT